MPQGRAVALFQLLDDTFGRGGGEKAVAPLRGKHRTNQSRTNPNRQVGRELRDLPASAATLKRILDHSTLRGPQRVPGPLNPESLQDSCELKRPIFVGSGCCGGLPQIVCWAPMEPVIQTIPKIQCQKNKK